MDVCEILSLQSIECDAVLDQKWNYKAATPTLAIAFASGMSSNKQDILPKQYCPIL